MPPCLLAVIRWLLSRRHTGYYTPRHMLRCHASATGCYMPLILQATIYFSHTLRHYFRHMLLCATATLSYYAAITPLFTPHVCHAVTPCLFTPHSAEDVDGELYGSRAVTRHAGFR